jgi:hypothetical protein
MRKPGLPENNFSTTILSWNQPLKRNPKEFMKQLSGALI